MGRDGQESGVRPRCPTCKYDLGGLPRGASGTRTCPECNGTWTRAQIAAAARRLTTGLVVRVFGWQAGLSVVAVIAAAVGARWLPRAWVDVAYFVLVMAPPTLAVACAASFCIILRRRGERAIDLVPAAIFALIVAGVVFAAVHVVWMPIAFAIVP